MENNVQNLNTEILERLVRLETKIDTFRSDISKCETISDNNKNEILVLKNRADTLDKEVSELKDKITWVSRVSWGAIISVVGGIILAVIKTGFSI